jgi:hypothetical protein
MSKNTSTKRVNFYLIFARKASIKMEAHMQAIIGTDKKNPFHTIIRNLQDKTIEVYFGFALMEVIRDKPNNPELKHLIARLFNAGVNRTNLIRNFGYSYPAMKRWAEAIKTGDAQTIVHALSGQGAPKKLTVEIQSFVTHRFNSVYADNKYSFSKEISIYL